VQQHGEAGEQRAAGASSPAVAAVAIAVTATSSVLTTWRAPGLGQSASSMPKLTLIIGRYSSPASNHGRANSPNTRSQRTAPVRRSV
jgi:hypothetical protein